MRLEEFANAQDQLDLWKLVSDAVWAGINTQGQQQQQVQAQVATKSKAQPKTIAKRSTARRMTGYAEILFGSQTQPCRQTPSSCSPRHAMTCVAFEKTASISTCSIGSVGCLG